MLVQNQGQESPTESASSRDTSPTADGIVANNRENESNGNDYSRDTSPTADGFVMKKRENGRNGNDCFEQAGSRATSSTANGIVAKKRDNERNGNDYSRYTSPTADGFVMKKRENGRNDNDCSEQAGSRDTSPTANGIVRKKRENGRNDNDCSEQAGSRDTSPTANGIVGKKRENERNGNDYSRDRSPTANGFVMTKRENERNDNDCFEQSVVRRGIFTGDKITLRTIAEERVDVISEKMQVLPDEYLEELKNGLRVVLEGNGGSQQREEFLGLQKLVQSRSDLTPKMLRRAHRVQLEVLVAMKMGIQAFLHPNVCLSQTSLIEIFGCKRCRNIACQNQLPVDDCTCDVCTNKSGFCNVCMCVICTKFDFEVNTCRWIGCDLCSHWTHTDCAIRDGLICMGTSARVGTGQAEMLFRCRACNRTSELLGWVKDVFQHCAPTWSRTALMTELDIVERIFRGSEDVKGRKLFWKCEELVEKMKSGLPESAACRAILMFFQELDADPSRNAGIGEGGRLLAPQEACKQIAEVVQEAIRKMEMVAEEKLRMLKKARLNLETCDRELEDKAREAAELKLERQRRKQQIDELESIVKLKQAEADMFQLKADETRREAEMLQKIALAKSEKSEEDYRTRYLKLKLSEAEAEKQYLFQKMKSQDSSRATHGNDVNDSSHMFSNALKNVYNVSSSADCQTSERNSGRKNS